MGEKDFVAQAEKDRSNCDQSMCDHWGLSVWMAMADVHHAQSLFGYMRKWAIAKGRVAITDGKLKKTPKPEQPNHYTFWKYYEVGLSHKFSIVQGPLATKST
ncbi:hypothetical protein AUC71_12570 [Methyloceanibacter marginalis]|uniref:Uncharacterized protein n=1 Tax=Methyloceanibacter marginalis TaxID=1774971 RepID=A0A1E3WBN2_9HYPH|nr:hypothetical protein [Methyloceanibacter marginalis]ODS02932.1 hypothetical protein AUC71_12570 [Methyloceanibacter marginalis]